MAFPQTTRCGATLVALATVLSCAACVGKPASEYEQQVDAQCPIEPTQASGEIKIGYQVILGTELYTRDRGLAEACMPNANVDWIRFPTGQDVVKAMASESIDLGFLGSTPTAKALSAPLNLDVVVTRVNTVIGSSEALVAKDPNVASASDLRGARIAVPFSSTAHYSLLNALRTAGLDPAHDVELVNLSPDSLPAAWQSDSIDATYVWDPVLSEVAESGHVVLTSTDVAESGAPTYNFSLASRPWVDTNPELVATWSRLQEWVAQLAASDPDEFAQGNANQVELSLEETERQLGGVSIVSGEEQDERMRGAAQVLVDTSEFLSSEGEVDAPLSPEDAARAVVDVEEARTEKVQ